MFNNLLNGKKLSIVIVILLMGGQSIAQTELQSSRKIAVTWNDPATSTGFVQGMMVQSPWDFITPVVVTGANVVLRSADGMVYAVSQTDDTITIIDADQWTVLNTISVGSGSELQDIAVVSSNTAYVTRKKSTHLLRLDLNTGVLTETVDLSIYADADGIPEMGIMATQNGKLFIQIRRQNPFNTPQPPPMLAVMDISSEQLIDVDPQRVGEQAIELQGTFPKLKIKRAKANNRLYVSATGDLFDNGGVEVINTINLQSEGFIIDETTGDTGADISTVVFTRPDRGFVVFTTEFGISSHLHIFSTRSGVEPLSVITNRLGYTANEVAFDKSTNTIFYPDGVAPNAGVLVLDATTGQPLIESAVQTSDTPNDLALILPSGSFE